MNKSEIIKKNNVMKKLETLQQIVNKINLGEKLNASESNLMKNLINTYIKCNDFEFISRQILKYLNENHNPHTKIISDGLYVEIVGGIKNFNSKEYIID